MNTNMKTVPVFELLPRTSLEGLFRNKKNRFQLILKKNLKCPAELDGLKTGDSVVLLKKKGKGIILHPVFLSMINHQEGRIIATVDYRFNFQDIQAMLELGGVLRRSNWPWSKEVRYIARGKKKKRLLMIKRDKRFQLWSPSEEERNANDWGVTKGYEL
jgi:hypothetical protein